MAPDWACRSSESRIAPCRAAFGDDAPVPDAYCPLEVP